MSRLRSMRRSVELLRAFRFEQQDPDRFYNLLSEDAVGLLAGFTALSGKTVVDVGGGAGYLSAAARRAGARCLVVDPDPDELSWRGAVAPASVVADGRCLPLADGSVDIALCSNVLEHSRQPYVLAEELVRVVRADGGLVWISFTNWYSPWGGHETSPWHYRGGNYAALRYAERYGHPPKNLYGASLFPVHVGATMRWARSVAGVQVLDIGPRYHPSWARRIVHVPALREIATWNLELLLRRLPRRDV